MIHKYYLYIFLFFAVFTNCERDNYHDIVRADLLKKIKGFIAFSEKRANKIDYGRLDTDIYWVLFDQKDENNLVVIMQQPYYDSLDTDGFFKIKENFVFLYYSDSTMVKTDKLKHKLPAELPDQKSRESGLGYSAPNWAFFITEKGLQETFIGE